MKLSINLASRRYHNQPALKLFLAIIIIILLLILVFQTNSYLHQRQQKLSYQAHLVELRQQLQGKLTKKITQEELAAQRQTHELAKRLLQRDAFRWTVLFDKMENILPEGISLRSFNPDYDNNSLAIHGVAKELKSLQNLLDKLQEAKFNQIYLKEQGEVKVDNGRGGERMALSFSINLEGVF